MKDLIKIFNDFYKRIAVKIVIDMPVKQVAPTFNSTYVNGGFDKKIKKVFGPA